MSEKYLEGEKPNIYETTTTCGIKCAILEKLKNWLEHFLLRKKKNAVILCYIAVT